MVAPDSQAKHACRQAAIPLNALFKNPKPLHFSVCNIEFDQSPPDFDV